MESYARSNVTSRIQAYRVDSDGCFEAEEGDIRCHRGRQLQKQKRRESLGFSSETLFRTLFLLLLFSVATLSGSSGKGVALAFSFSLRDSCWGHNGCRISERIRKYGCCGNDRCGGIPLRGPQTQFQKNLHQRQQQRRVNWVLSSTTETSGHGGITAANVSSSSPVVATTGKSTTNATNAKVTESKSKRKSKSKSNPNRVPETRTTNTDDEYEGEKHHRQKVPRHVGLICDGNGRWATKRNLPRAAGHLEGARRLVDLIRSLVRERERTNRQKHGASEASVDCLTLYAFSTENWNRSPAEITKIFLAIEFAATAVWTAGDLAAVNVRVLGDLSDERIPASLKRVLSQLEERTRRQKEKSHRDGKHGDNLEVCLAINYGGRRDIVAACRALAEEVKDGNLKASDITEDALGARLGTGGMLPPDLIVRTGGEHRLSNFMLWESAYAELFVTPVLWPDFSCEGEWKHSLDWYSKRKRNFGGRSE